MFSSIKQWIKPSAILLFLANKQTRFREWKLQYTKCNDSPRGLTWRWSVLLKDIIVIKQDCDLSNSTASDTELLRIETATLYIEAQNLKHLLINPECLQSLWSQQYLVDFLLQSTYRMLCNRGTYRCLWVSEGTENVWPPGW